jgi:hypothetical protein
MSQNVTLYPPSGMAPNRNRPIPVAGNAAPDLKPPAVDPFTVTALQPGRDNRTGQPARTTDLPTLSHQQILDSIDAALSGPPGSR